MASYEAKWRAEDYLPAEVVTISLKRHQPASLVKYPTDHSLPGLAPAADPATALRLVDRHVFNIPRRVMGVEMVRYRPGSRAVLRHQAQKVRLYVRVVRPAAMPGLLAAASLVEQSKFVSPPVVGCWTEGGALWVPEMPGTNMREAMRHGQAPNPSVLLDGLESLWSLPKSGAACRPFNLLGAFWRAERTFKHALYDDQHGLRRLVDTTAVLRPFVESWQPNAVAHNDFYDDQMVIMDDGRVALVDFDEAGLGDPMLDVGTFLAHLKWASRHDNKHESDVRGAYYDEFKQAALDRFGWNSKGLALREAVCIFRICTNTIRRIKPDWRDDTLSGLELTNEALR